MKNILKYQLKNTKLLIGHYIKFDLLWLKECGLDYIGIVYDTAIAEYVLARGQKLGFSLDACLKRHKLDFEKGDIFNQYSGVQTNEIPIDM